MRAFTRRDTTTCSTQRTSQPKTSFQAIFRSSLVACGLAVGLLACNPASDTIPVQTVALVGQSFYLDLSSSRAWVVEERVLEAAESSPVSALAGGCRLELVSSPDGSVLDGATLLWVPESSQVGMHQIDVWFSSECSQAQDDMVSYEVEVQAPVQNPNAGLDATDDPNAPPDVHDFE